MTEKAQTFLDNNKTWFSWGSVVSLLGLAIWLIQSMNGVSNAINVLNVKFDTINDQNGSRNVYVDSRIADMEGRIRECEKKFN